MSKKHTIILSDQEQQILEKLINERGYRKQELFRANLRSVYRREFPQYSQPKRKVNEFERMSNADYCTKVLGGTIVDDRCQIQRFNGSLSVPLLGIKLHKNFE